MGLESENLWAQVLAEAELEVSNLEFSSLFAPTKLSTNGAGQLVVSCRNNAECFLLETRHKALIRSLIENKTGSSPEISFTVKEGEAKKENLGPLFSPLSNPLGLDPLCTMENFAVSGSNQLAYAAAQAVIDAPGRSYNPLFLWGGVGVGKTHLMQAIGHAILKKGPEARIVFCTGEEFTNEIIAAIRNKKTAAFKNKYRSAQLLLLDDIQFIADKIKVQEEFFHTFVRVKKEGGQVVLTSDRPPAEIHDLEARLRSRFEAGLIADITPPTFELRTAIVLIKARLRGKEVPMEIARLLAQEVEDTRRLEGFLVRLFTEAEIDNTPLSLDLVARLLGKEQERRPPRPLLPVGEALKKLAARFNLSVSALKGKGRSRPIAVPRQIAMFLLREEYDLSYQDIGALLGGRDHTTIMYGVQKVEEQLLNDPRWAGDIKWIKKRVWGEKG